MLNEQKLNQEIENVIDWVKNFVKNANADGVVVGNSGGKDSATVIAIATKALGEDKVVTVAMPCSSISTDLEDAKLVANTFGVPLLEVDITNECNLLIEKINTQLNNKLFIKEMNKEASINIKPRLRMTTIYAVAKALNYLVIGTGNLCEGFVGYTTKWGDNACDFNPIANFTVEEVLKIGEVLGVPREIINKAPNDGLGGQTDEEKMGVTYKQIAQYIETGATDKEVIEKIEKMNKVSKHKREQIPTYYFER